MSERASPPVISTGLVRWFTWYSAGYIRKHFHSLRVSSQKEVSIPNDLPLIVYSNHPSWWDPLVGLVLLKSKFPGRPLYAPMDAAMLRKYRMFARMGFFGVEKDTRKGATDFLKISTTVLSDPKAILAVTAQGRFADVRERPVTIKRGLAHLAANIPNACFLPASIEYVFWEEKRAEILVRLGSPILLKPDTNVEHCQSILEQSLERTQEELAELSKSRKVTAFETLIAGRSGPGGIYDMWRKTIAIVRGDKPSTESVV